METVAPRSVRVPLLLTAAGTVAYTLLVPFAPPATLVSLQILVMLLVNGFAIVAMRARAAQMPAESRGWNCFALGYATVVLANFVMMFGALTRGAGVTVAWIDLTLMVVAGVLQLRGLLALPWKRPYEKRTPLHVLGSLIFVASIVVLFWMLEVWQGGFRGSLAWQPSLVDLVRLGNTNVAIRAVFLAGVSVFLVSEQPKRVFGPGGLVLCAALLMIVGVTGSSHAVPNGGGGTPGGALWITLGQAVPIVAGLAAWSRQPLEPSTTSRVPEPLSIAMQYVPFVIVGIFLTQIDSSNKTALAWSLVAFLAISFVVVLRQVLLFRAIRAANKQLEERVQERTQRLERLQALMLRTERLNTLATMGAGLAHDLNNLLQTIGMSVELMQLDAKRGRPSQPELFSELVTGTVEAGRLTERLMLFARDEMGTAERTMVDVTAAVAAQEDLLRMLLPKSIELRMVFEGPRRSLNLPSTLVEQTLVNLVSNARDAMPAGGAVTVRVRGEEVSGCGKVLIEVTDTGQGIPPELQAEIFETFFSTKAGRGTGIGLASVRALMESVGGAVSVRSSVGQGATFTLSFPLDSVRGEM